MKGVQTRALDWHRRIHAEFCDVHEPWEHGTVVRATRYPNYYDLNTVRVEDDPGMGADELAAFADQALAGLAHRRVDFERVEVGAALRERFEALGWLTEQLVWMRHEGALPAAGEIAVEEVPYEDVRDLRVSWHQEDFPGVDPTGFLDQSREAAERRDAQVLAVRDAGRPIAYTQLERCEGSAEIAHVYVHPDHRGRGLGTAITCAAIHAAGRARDLWIVADDEGRAKELYARLGFRPVWTAVQTLRLP